MTLQLQIKQERIRQGISQEELGAKSGLVQAAIARFESGKNNPHLRTAIRLATALGKEIQLV